MENNNYLRVIGYIDEEVKKTSTEGGVQVRIHLTALTPDEQDISRYTTSLYTVVADAELAEYAFSNFQKGDPILVEGEPVYESSEQSGGQKLLHIVAYALLKVER